MTQEMNRIVQIGIPRILKIEWLDVFIAGRHQAFMTQNIVSGWSSTGLHPFNLQKVLGCVSISPLIDIPL